MFQRICQVFFLVGVVAFLVGLSLVFPFARPLTAKAWLLQTPTQVSEPLTPRPPLTPTPEAQATATPAPPKPAPEATATPYLLPVTGNTGKGSSTAWLFCLLGLFFLMGVWGLYLRRRSL